MAAFGERFGFQFVAHAIGNAPFGAGGETVQLYRGQLPSRAHLQQLGGSESAGTGVVR